MRLKGLTQRSQIVGHSYVMSLGFTEIDPVFAEDYDEKPLTGNDLPGFLFADT